MLCWLVLLLLPLLPLLLLLLPAVALHRCLGASLARLASLQQQVAWGALGWAATWQRYRLEQSTRHAARSQHQALARCLRGARRAPGGSTDMSTFRNLLPLTKPSQAPEEQNGGQEQLPASSQYPQEAALQATVLGVAALGQAHPATMSPGATARVTPASPWPCPLPWLGPILGQAGPPGAEDPRALLLAALRSPGLRALEARTATELLDVFSGLEAAGQELVEAIAAGDPGAPLPGRAAEVRAALERGPRGLALQLWPQLQVVVTLDAGGQAEAAAALRALWCHGLAFFSPAYAASGGAAWAMSYRWLAPITSVRWSGSWTGRRWVPRAAPCEPWAPAPLPSSSQAGPGPERPRGSHQRASVLPGPGPGRGAVARCQVAGPLLRGEQHPGLLRGLRSALRGVPGAEGAEESVGGKSQQTRLPLSGLCPQLDLCLQDASPHYKFLRFRGSVGPSHVHLVARGAFSALRAALAARLSSSAPPAMPRVLRHRQLAQLLQRRLLS
ncbi:GH3 domain-containing protein isoform X7 [Heterocephalus glaber]|uniref:GH3 domain-containing protein isoform X7 n=1 Tax=Heterocephalus glaber TaxID=10181 RepID=A0AAX6PVA8_HETGA|nr:GH3 domain-containing protein isoform X7 [Heterocephalus glaber]